MIRKDVYRWNESLPMTTFFEDDLIGFYAWLQGNIYELPETSLYYYRFAAKNICAVSSMLRFVDMKTALAFEKRDTDIQSHLKKSKWTGLELCEKLLESGTSVFRSREELKAEQQKEGRL